MALTLPRAPRAYDVADEQSVRGLIEAADRETLKRGRDLDLGAVGVGLILVSPDGTRWRLSVGDEGVLGTAAI
jgi:hypothetical protein